MATQRTSTFAPNDVTIVLVQASTGIDHIVTGFSEDSIITIERNAETFTLYVGADNTSTRVYNANTSANMTVSLAQTSASNDVLTALYDNDRATLSSDGMFSITVKDNSGRSVFFSEEAYIAVVPNSAFANSMQTRDWVIHATDMSQTIGGNQILNPADQATLTTLGVSLDGRWTTA